MQRGRIMMSGTADEVYGRIDEIEATYFSGPTTNQPIDLPEVTMTDPKTRSRSTGRPSKARVRAGAQQAHDQGSAHRDRDLTRPVLLHVPRRSVHPIRRAGSARRRDRRCDHRRRSRWGPGRHRSAERARDRAHPAHRRRRRDRWHLVLEPVPRGDVRRRVLRLHAQARGDGLRAHDSLHVRRGRSGAAPRHAQPAPLRPGRTGALFHTTVQQSKWDEEDCARSI